MDTVKSLREQTTTGKLIHKLLANFKKDGALRKTAQYCEERLINLQLLFDKFSQIDAELIHSLEEDHPYISKEYFKQVKGIYVETKQLLEKAQNQAQPGTSNITAKQQAENEFENKAADESSYIIDDDETEEITIPTITSHDEEQQKRYKIQAAKIKMLRQNIKSISKYGVANKSFIDLKIKQLSDAWNSINDIHEQIIVNATDADYKNEYFQRNILETIQSEYELCIIDAHSRMETEISSPHKQVEQNKAKIKLPTIEIPTFFGDYKQWTSFHGLFNKTVHCNKGLSQEEKMYYLLSLIRGPAAKLINHLTISENNYETAWASLISRYQDKRLLTSTHVNMLLDLPTLTTESPIGLRTMHDTTAECLSAINNLGVQTEDWGPLVIGILTRKLDVETHRAYEGTIKHPKEVQTLKDFLNFLETRFQTLTTIARDKGNRKSFTPHQPQFKANKTAHIAATKEINCNYCCGKHDITSCKTFTDLSVNERTAATNKNNLCRRCLQKYHGKFCSNRCNVCKRAHHSLLHASEKAMKTHPVESTTTTALQTANTSSQGGILLATAMVKVSNGNSDHLVRVLIDPGSQATFITEELAKNLRLPKTPIRATIAGMGLTEAGTAQSSVEFIIRPRFASNFKLKVNAMVFKRITSDMPDRIIKPNNWNHTKNLIWADPTFYEPGPIDILLGADYYGQVIMPSLIKGSPNEPIAQQTKLGWIIIGNTSANNNIAVIQSMVIATNDVDDQLKRFWEIEEISQGRAPSKEENECEQHFNDNYLRNADGTYEVRIPFKREILATNPLGNSRKTAVARLLQVEKSLNRKPELAIQYQQFMEEYEALGHMKKVTGINSDTGHYYLPHHAVMKEDSTTTKLRVVFDASAKTTTGISLNGIMMNGPTLQQNLLNILVRWRKHKYVYTADVEKMFRQIRVHENDQNYQRILWRSSQNELIQEYQLTTVTYGTTAATYLAVRTLQQLARDEIQNYPIASEIALNDFYVDDLISGNYTIDKALEAQEQLIALLKSGGFNLRKWATNDQRLLDAIPINLRNSGLLEFKLDDTIKTLGLHWNPANDTFGFRVSLPNTGNNAATKRSLLSESAKIFDPLGWLAPVTIVAKLAMQELWLAGISWDQKLPTKIYIKWQKFKEALTSIENIAIPRWLSYDSESSLSLHGFCDASEKAYAAVIYTRNINKDGNVNVTLVSAKTKVAPIKTILSLPRLELCAALLLTKLMKQVKESLNEQDVETSYWTDSMITLSWIRGHPHKYKTFIANRISEIQEQSNPAQWHHINTKENPADCATRGIHPTELKDNNLWWTGPEWLQNPPSVWPQQIQLDDGTTVELKRVMTITSSTVVNPFEQLLERISSINKIFRIISYCRRFIKKCLKRETTDYALIPTCIEIKEAQEILCRIIQHEEFRQDIVQLQKQGAVSAKSKLLSLNPRIDNQNLLRVGGRITNSHLIFETKHPIILPPKHRLTKLLIDNAHQSTLHGGTQLTLAFFRKKYWITNGRSRIRAEINNCTTCHRFNLTSKQQLMADLPQGRVTPSRPFTHTGVDFAGPMQVRVSKGRGTKTYKGYIAVFVCFSTKAVHLEIVSDLTAIAFVAAFKRFIARRGMCQHIYSDNGTNFVGARSILEKEKREYLKQAIPKLQNFLSINGMQWHFIPPSAPHFGGLWEAAVKSMKHHLKRVIGEATLTYEELSTVVSQIEACLNSRPLTAVTADPSDIVLTPGHFLIGDSLLANLQPNLLLEKVSLGQRWNLVQRIVQDFWKRWSTDYLSSLQQRTKWNSKQPEVKVDDIVLVKDNNLPPTRWPLGRIVELHPGQDNITRVVTIRNAQGLTCKRPISKLSVLPIDKKEAPESTSNIGASNRRTCGLSRVNLMPFFVLALLMVTGIHQGASANPAPYNITTFHHQAGLYFEHTGNVQFTNTQWKIIVYFNMGPYHTELKSYFGKVKNLEQLCLNTSNGCSPIISLLQHILLDIKQKDEMLNHGKQHRQKRGAINIIGNIANELFGTLDNRDAEHYEQEIEKGKENQEYLLQLIKNQTSITDATLNLLKKNEAEIIHHWNLFNQQIESQLKDINNVNQFTVIAIQLLMALLNFKEVQQHVMEAVLNTNNKVINTAILPPTRLLQEVNKISKQLPPDVILPGHQRPDQTLILYQLMSCKGSLNDQYAIFELKLPLLNKEKFQLYKPIPFPTTNGTFIQPSMSYLATSMHRDQYYALSTYEFHHCKLVNINYICILLHPTYSVHHNSSICELQLLTSASTSDCAVSKQIAHNSRNSWIKLKNNKWLFSLQHTQPATIVCGEDVTAMTLPQNGKISLNEGCTLRTGSITLKSHKVIKKTIDLSFLPAVNLSTSWTTSHRNTVLNEVPNAKEFSNLHEKIKEIQNTSLKPSIHDVHHYTTTYIIVGLIAISLAIYFWRIRRRPPLQLDYNLQVAADNRQEPVV